FHVDCHFECNEPILVNDNAMATHLYRIAQEAINNGIKHGKATSIMIGLQRKLAEAELAVTDNGIGFRTEIGGNGGMGLQIMKYRAGMIGASLQIGPANDKGTTVVCLFKVEP